MGLIGKAGIGVALAFLFAGGPARADIADFYGNWENAKRDASGIAHVQISPAGGNHVSVRVYGRCHPTECNWGKVDAQSYAADPRTNDIASISAVFHLGFVSKQIIIRRAGGGELQFEALCDFADGTGRHDFAVTGKLEPTAWGGPVGQSWDRRPNLGGGWGGGAHGGASPRPDETCLAFDPKAARTIRVGANWRVAAGALTLAEAGADERAARRVREVIRHYRFDRKCHAASLTYWRRGTTIPSRKMGGADCILFNSTTVHTARVGHSWKIIDGVKWIADFGKDKGKADAALALIRRHRFEAECFVARSNPVMTYWLKR